MTNKAEPTANKRAPNSRPTAAKASREREVTSPPHAPKSAVAEAALAEMLPKEIGRIENHERGAASLNGRYVPFARARPPVSPVRLPWLRIDDPEQCAG